jgi:polysaccharide deacetylase family protein (PEP-CTERM system associated)
MRHPRHGTLKEPPVGSNRPARPSDAVTALPARLTFTADIERSPGDPTGTRHLAATAALLDLLDETGARGTFFILGEVADSAPWLVCDIAARGHEIASHNQTHRPLAALTPPTLREEAHRARATLQDLSGQPVKGFRAPFFSLTPATEWAADTLLETGHAYSSSVIPARAVLHGHPTAPRRPFLWPGGLLELPAPIVRLGPIGLPILGGMYLRYLPEWDFRRFARRLEGPLAWTYCHPYDIDAGAPFHRCPDLGLLSSLFLWANRSTTARRLRAMLAGRSSLPLAERLEEAWNIAGRRGDIAPGPHQDANAPPDPAFC